MLESRTISVSIAIDWRDLYEAVWRPEVFPRWASGLSRSSLRRYGDGWRADGPEGPVTIRFTARNSFGIMDHWVETGTGVEIYVPLRIVPNGAGAVVLLTVFRQPGMSDAIFARDMDWVRRDLDALKSLAAGNLGRGST